MIVLTWQPQNRRRANSVKLTACPAALSETHDTNHISQTSLSDFGEHTRPRVSHLAPAERILISDVRCDLFPT
jgi:hypothetical protein